MKNKAGIVSVLAAIFIGLFSLLSGLVGGTFFGAKATAKACDGPIAMNQRDSIKQASLK